MFDDEAPQEKERIDYTGYKIGGALAPLLILFLYQGKEAMGMAVYIVSGAVLVAIALSWELRKHIWYWIIIGLILALNIPFLFYFRMPQGNIPLIVYIMPFGIADYLLTAGAIQLGKRMFLRRSLTDEEEE